MLIALIINGFSLERDHIALRAQGLQTVCFTWKQLQAATKNFDEANKLGEGGFGSVFKVLSKQRISSSQT